ncbi:uncharacterized protein LOC120920089 [Rana temporaria]|uniref:uncharacterized protein LOC120920089 n=1 Tax=Rana temporaria TaxID=8407 RepID=UPI001AAC9913|nr:uncharacterized protein LOC120920089 [Rana temporaria]
MASEMFNSVVAVVLLVVPVGCAIIPEVNDDPCVDLIFCTLKWENNYCEFYHGSDFVITYDRTTWNIAQKLKNRSTIIKYGDYECATIKNLQESDTGDYALHISKEDGERRLRKTFSLSDGVLKCLLNVSDFNVNTSRIGVDLPIYRRKNYTEMPEALRLTARNGKMPKDFSLGLVLTAQDLANEGSMDVTTPTATTPPPGNAKIYTKMHTIIIIVAVVVVIYIGAIVKCYCTSENGAAIHNQP